MNARQYLHRQAAQERRAHQAIWMVIITGLMFAAYIGVGSFQAANAERIRIEEIR